MKRSAAHGFCGKPSAKRETATSLNEASEGVVDEQRFDILIIGSGEAGKYLAWTMAKAGRRTAVVERKLIGGACPNIACLPSKNIIHSAKVAELARRGAEFGIHMGAVAVDMVGVRARKREMVDRMIDIHLDRLKASGAELILGEARFVAPKTVDVKMQNGGMRRIAGDHVFLNVGTRATIPDVPGLRSANPLTHIEALELDRVPQHLLVLGGGFVGLEMAQAMRRFGSEVTILQMSAQLVDREDSDVAAELLSLFEDEGAKVILNAELLEVEGLSGRQVKARLRTPQGERVIEASHLLAATGRAPNTQGLGLENTGVDLDARGYIRVNERLQTTAPAIWAMGDCAGSPHFTHVSFDDFRIVRDNLNGGDRTSHGRLVPFCLFTDPELARVGLSETEARDRGIPYRLTKIPIAAVLRTQTLSEKRGFLKALISTTSDEILGFTALGVNAGEIMSVVQTSMLAGQPYTTLRDAIFAHPTMAEGLGGLFAAVPARSKTGAGAVTG